MMGPGDRTRRRIQRGCDCGRSGCSGCNGLQRAPRGEAPTVVPQSAYAALRSPGEPLSDVARRQHARTLGHDLYSVRVHRDTDAAVAAEEMNAFAFTLGHDIVMAADAPHEQGPAGRELLHHELAHAVRHQPAATPHEPTTGMLHLQPSDSADEREAARMGAVPEEPEAADESAEPPADGAVAETGVIPEGNPAVDADAGTTDEVAEAAVDQDEDAGAGEAAPRETAESIPGADPAPVEPMSGGSTDSEAEAVR